MKYIVFAFLFFCCYKIFKEKGINKFIWFITGMLMINSSYSPIIHSNSHYTLAIAYLLSLFIDPSFKISFKKYPIKELTILILITHILIGIFCEWQSVFQSLYRSILDYSITFLMLFTGYHAINTNKDYDLLIKKMKPILLITAIYGLICFLLKDNPYNKLVGISDVGINYDFFETNRGYRIAGFSNTSNPHAHLLTVLSFIIINRERNKFTYTLVILSLLNLLLSDSRAPLADLIILVSSYFLLTKGLSQKIKIICTGGILLLLLMQIPFIATFTDNLVMKITDTFAAEGETEVTGSSIALRLTQIESAWQYFIQKPFFGHGFGFYPEKIYIANTDNNGLWGMESYLLWLLVEQGIFMIILVFLFYSKILSCIIKYNHISYYKVPLTLTIVLIFHILLNRPTDVYEYFLPFIGIGIKLLQINKQGNKCIPQLNTL